MHLHCWSVCCSVLECVGVCDSVLQCVAACKLEVGLRLVLPQRQTTHLYCMCVSVCVYVDVGVGECVDVGLR